jgi:hypothetical protein
MNQVFISYRRTDEPTVAALLYDQLVQRLGRDCVFLDKSCLIPGELFPPALDQALQSCALLVAVIGRRWAGPVRGGSARIWNDDDFVRRELRTGLTRGIKVVPIIVGPHEVGRQLADLPPDLEELHNRQAIRIRPEESFTDTHSAVDRLIALLGRHASSDPPSSGAPTGPLSTPQDVTIDGTIYTFGESTTIGIRNEW